MSDEQLRRKAILIRICAIALVINLLSGGLFYYHYITTPVIEAHDREMSMVDSVRAQINRLTEDNNILMSRIESSGEELVSFSEDKIKYINLASQLSQKYSVIINHLTVSDVWLEGEMSGMTTIIEVEGKLAKVRDFLSEYCSVNNVNRIKTISCRPAGRYAWLSRSIDGQEVISWFDLGDEQLLHDAMEAEEEAAKKAGQTGATSILTGMSQVFSEQYMYNEKTGRFEYILSGEEVPQSVLDKTPITLEKMFADQKVKVYLIVDFLGRS